MKKFILALLLSLSTLPVNAATIAATTCSRTDVTTAITASTYGDTVTVPACSPTTWTSTVNITKGIILQGAGIGVTQIVSNVGASNFLITYTPDATSRTNDQPFRITGFSFNMNNASGGVWITQASNTLPLSHLRIDHNAFSNTAGDTSLSVACIRLGDLVGTPGTFYGLIDQNTFTDCGACIQSYANEVFSWDNFTYTYGSINNVYIEDNTFTGNSAFIYGAHGGRYAARFNSFHLTGSVYQVTWDVHGNQNSGVYSTMGCEIYRNTVVLDTGTANLDHRGGTCMVFQNTTTGTSPDWQVREEFDDAIDPTTNPTPQHVSDSYYILNTVNGSNITVTETQDCCAAIAPNVQYWNYTASFTGATGVGSGTLAGRPGTCTTGVGYWATDQGNWNTGGAGGQGLFYKCTSTNAWSLYYTPLAYPHPARASASTSGGNKSKGKMRMLGKIPVLLLLIFY